MLLSTCFKAGEFGRDSHDLGIHVIVTAYPIVELNRDLLCSFVEQHFGAVERILVKPLDGGLDSCGICRVCVTLSPGQAKKTASFVAKRVPDSGVHEANLYRMLTESPVSGFVPRLLDVRRDHGHDIYMFLEWIQPRSSWPWRDQRAVRAVMHRLADLHSQPLTGVAQVLADRHFESELQGSAALTAELYGRAFMRRSGTGMRPMYRAIRRIADDLISIRRHLFAASGIALLHGDAHSGNFVIRGGKGQFDAVLLDWGRARVGSPLEDVASWLQSLAFWEPQVRKLHDSLLVYYLQCAGKPVVLERDCRRLYWLAAASNAMAGALRYHLETMLNLAVPRTMREQSAALACDWLRIVRRADNYWRSGDESGRQSGQLQTANLHSAIP